MTQHTAAIPAQPVDPIPPLTQAEQALVGKFNNNPKYTHDGLISTLQNLLQTAAEIELATIPIYLYAYYSINRAPIYTSPQMKLFANMAGATIMSVAVEEMLHMSLSCNILYAIGGQPQLYGKSPSTFPTNLPGHERLGPDAKPMAIPLARFSYNQLWKFLEIEYPATADAPPEDANWQTIGQIYSYIRCIISCNKLTDSDFQAGAAAYQVQPENYSPNNIDTVSARAAFVASQPPSGPDSAASQAAFANRPDSHAGAVQLLTIQSKTDALAAIATISDQGEGYRHTSVDDPSKQELSHYYKFLTLQSALPGYPELDKLPAAPPPPPAAPVGPGELYSIVFPFPDNPTTATYPADFQDLSNFCNGLYQYMLILTETIFKVPSPQQKQYFNKALHLSMIWMLDKLVQGMRTFQFGPVGPFGNCLAPTFENYDLGTRGEAYANLVVLANKLKNHPRQWSAIGYIVTDYLASGMLPDVSGQWPTTTADRAALPAVAAAPNPFANVPAFPANPVPSSPSHACMGLNGCKGQDRFGPTGHPDPADPTKLVVNDCAGQGYCSTAVDHSCHVLNSCANQGGCGLYGTGKEQNNPGQNTCEGLGSCATPINAERFSTNGPNADKSVWLRARQAFLEKQWPAIAAAHNPPLDPSQLPAPPHPELFSNGPTYAWISASNCMTACGSSGMSGAGSCA
jgi:hypothetical protein